MILARRSSSEEATIDWGWWSSSSDGGGEWCSESFTAADSTAWITGEGEGSAIGISWESMVGEARGRRRKARTKPFACFFPFCLSTLVGFIPVHDIYTHHTGDSLTSLLDFLVSSIAKCQTRFLSLGFNCLHFLKNENCVTKIYV